MGYVFAPELWTNVGGQTDAAGLQAALADLENVGFTFGGKFAGHGVYAVGSARFVLTDPNLAPIAEEPPRHFIVAQISIDPADFRRRWDAIR
jgi:hypothetical protein